MGHAYDEPFVVDFYFGQKLIASKVMRILPNTGDTWRARPVKEMCPEYVVVERVFIDPGASKHDIPVEIYLRKKV